MSLTAEYLVNEIRRATELADLKRIVGPSDEEDQLSIQRLDKIDRLYEKAQANAWGADPKGWPFPYSDTYVRLMDEQRQYENLYL